jgi:hypothetical protein
VDAFNKAENWRRRAKELRALADSMQEPAAAASLCEIADSLEHHAANLEQIMVKVCRLQRPRTVPWRQAS